MDLVKLYFRKPHPISAIQNDGSIAAIRAIIEWTRSSRSPAFITDVAPNTQRLVLNSLAGTVVIEVGDFVTRDTLGDHYRRGEAEFLADHNLAVPE